MHTHTTTTLSYFMEVRDSRGVIVVDALMLECPWECVEASPDEEQQVALPSPPRLPREKESENGGGQVDNFVYIQLEVYTRHRDTKYTGTSFSKSKIGRIKSGVRELLVDYYVHFLSRVPPPTRPCLSSGRARERRYSRGLKTENRVLVFKIERF